MADDALRMQAEVVDKFSGPLKNLQTQLRGISGGPGIATLKKDLETVQGHMAKTASAITGLMNPALAGFGIAAIGAGGALAGIGAAARGFATDTAGLAYLSREVGISTDKLRQLEELGRRFNLDPATVDKSAQHFADQLDQMHRNRGELYNFLLQQSAKDPTGNVAKWTDDIKHAKTAAEAYQKTLDMIASIKDPLQRGDIAAQAFGDRGMGVLGSEGLEGLHKQQAEVEKSLGTMRKGAEDTAIAFNREISSMQATLRGLRDDLGADLMKPLNEGLREFGGWLRENRGEIEQTLVTGLRDFRKVLKETNWDGIGAGLMTMLRGAAWTAEHVATAMMGIVQAGRDMRSTLDRLGITDTTREKRIGEIDKDIATLQDNRKHAHDGFFGKIMGDHAERDIDGKISELQAEKQRLIEERNTDEIKKNTEELRKQRERSERKDSDDAKLDPTSAEGGGLGGLIQRASFGGGGGFGRGGLGGSDGGGSYGGLREALSRGSGASSAQIGKLARNANAQTIIGELRKAGYGDNAIAAIVGSMQTESTFNPRAHNDIKGTHDGLWQWDRRRWANVRRWIQGQGGDPYDAGWQTKAWIAEHNAKPGDAIYDNRNTERGGQILRRDPSLREAIDGVRQSERFGRGEEGGRAANAEKWLPHVRGTAEGDTRRKLQDARKDDGKGDTFPNGAPRVLIPKSMEGKAPGTVMDRGVPARRPDLMGRARATIMAANPTKAEGQVHVNVNAPPGWRSNTTSKGNLFTEVKMNRGHAMQLADQEA